MSDCVYPYTQSRIYDIVSAGRTVQIMPIFSAETSFMGPWLTNNPITKPYRPFFRLRSRIGECQTAREPAGLPMVPVFTHAENFARERVDRVRSGPTTFAREAA